MSLTSRMLIAIAAGAIAATSLSGDYHYVEPAQEIVYTVQHGDTLWSIAKENCSDAENILEVIHDIKTNNDITAEIHPGQQIILHR